MAIDWRPITEFTAEMRKSGDEFLLAIPANGETIVTLGKPIVTPYGKPAKVTAFTTLLSVTHGKRFDRAHTPTHFVVIDPLVAEDDDDFAEVDDDEADVTEAE